MSTARTTLYYLAEAHFIARSTWRARGLSHERGQVWTLTVKGNDLLQRYAPYVPPLARIDLGRPSTALEHEEWRVRLQIRTLLVQLLLEARRASVLHSLEVQLPGNANWPTVWDHAVQPEPDALISVVWQPAERQSADWLPWLASTQILTSAIHYPIYIERAHAHANVAALLSRWVEASPASLYIPVVILQDEDRYASASLQLASLSQMPAIRLATWAILDKGITNDQWRNGHGLPCSLLALSEDVVS